MNASGFKYFAIFGAMRTGSNLLERNLNQYDGITCHGEAFNPAFIGKAGQEELLGVDLATREADPSKLINKMVNKSGDSLPGFRIFQGHDPRVFEASLKDPECAKIILRRRPLDSFVSLQIALATDQWILGNAPKRRTETVHYDGSEYRAYLADLATYETALRRGLQEAGQSAFELRFEDLKSADVMNGLAAYLGVEDRRGSFEEKIKRQNPEPLSEKVSNYEEMMADLGALGSESVQVDRAPETERGFGLRDIIVCQNTAALFAPLPGVNAEAVLGMMGQFDGTEPGQLKTGLNQKELGNWLDAAPDHAAFTLVDHPLTRAYSVFMSHIFPPEGTPFPKIRRRLNKHFDVPLPESLDGWSVVDHSASFEAYLVFLKANLAGQTSIRIDALWEAQHKLVAAISQVQPVARIIRSDDLESVASDLASSLGKPAPVFAHKDAGTGYQLQDIYARRLENLARAAYAKDYRMFGFGDWTP